eukprot:11204652-Prorocentrum_lima.AAC.1
MHSTHASYQFSLSSAARCFFLVAVSAMSLLACGLVFLLSCERSSNNPRPMHPAVAQHRTGIAMG